MNVTLLVEVETPLNVTSVLAAVISKEKPAIRASSAEVVPVFVNVTSRLLDDEPGCATFVVIPKIRPAWAEVDPIAIQAMALATAIVCTALKS